MDFMMDEELRARTTTRAKETKATMTVIDYEDVIAARQTARSPRIPFPNYHVHRTQSEIELCHDKELANQHELIMFHRLVNGIRERQVKLGLGAEDMGVLSPALMKNIPQAIRQANPLLFPPLPTGDVTILPSTRPTGGSGTPSTTSGTTGSKLTWMPQATIVPQDDWSISGFEGQGDDGSTTSDQPFGWAQRGGRFTSSTHPADAPRLGLQGTSYRCEDTITRPDEQEDIFQLDL